MCHSFKVGYESSQIISHVWSSQMLHVHSIHHKIKFLFNWLWHVPSELAQNWSWKHQILEYKMCHWLSTFNNLITRQYSWYRLNIQKRVSWKFTFCSSIIFVVVTNCFQTFTINSEVSGDGYTRPNVTYVSSSVTNLEKFQNQLSFSLDVCYNFEILFLFCAFFRPRNFLMVHIQFMVLTQMSLTRQFQ